MTTRKLRIALLLSMGFWLLASTAQAAGTQQQPDVLFASTMLGSEIRPVRPITNDSGLLTATAPDSSSVAHRLLKAPQVPLNPAAVKFVQDYIQKNNEVLQKVEARSAAPFKIIESILVQYDLPVELKYLAVIESDLKSSAVSRVGAAGPWQLMPGTARELGLHVSRKWDERKHYAKSTVAAAKYLRDLYGYYNDWLLVIAAYNAGPLIVDRAIRRSGSRNFWKLQYFLPAETRGHVKRFISTHYFFEDGGSETTLTKAEAQAYAKAVSKFYNAQECQATLKPIVSLASENATATTTMTQ
jgi:membrane-bound lytic murein transglycosylase D